MGRVWRLEGAIGLRVEFSEFPLAWGFSVFYKGLGVKGKVLTSARQTQDGEPVCGFQSWSR